MFFYNPYYFWQPQVPIIKKEFEEPPHLVKNEEQLVRQEENQMASLREPDEFWQIFQKEIRNREAMARIKQWSDEEDQLLLKMANSGKDWNQISKKLGGKGEEVCIRRLSKLKKKEKNWPREKELKIKHMFEVEGKSWIEIQRHFPDHTAKQIRQRYKNFLQISANKENWALEEDKVIWKKVSELGKKWKKISTLLNRRTELQIKNRYYKTLKPIGKKVKRKLNGNGKKSDKISQN